MIITVAGQPLAPPRPRQAGRRAPARGRTSAGPMRPGRGRGSYRRPTPGTPSARALFIPAGF